MIKAARPLRVPILEGQRRTAARQKVVDRLIKPCMRLDELADGAMGRCGFASTRPFEERRCGSVVLSPRTDTDLIVLLPFGVIANDRVQ